MEHLSSAVPSQVGSWPYPTNIRLGLNGFHEKRTKPQFCLTSSLETKKQKFYNTETSRNELAKLCGYPTFAHRATVESLAENPEKIDAFLNKLSRELRPRVSKDYDTMLALKKKANPSSASLEMWDVPYFTTMAKNNFFQASMS